MAGVLFSRRKDAQLSGRADRALFFYETMARKTKDNTQRCSDDDNDFVEESAAHTRVGTNSSRNVQEGWSEFERQLDQALSDGYHSTSFMLEVIETVILATRREGVLRMPDRVMQKAATLAAGLGDAAPEWIESVASILLTPISFEHARRSLATNKLEVCQVPEPGACHAQRPRGQVLLLNLLVSKNSVFSCDSGASPFAELENIFALIQRCIRRAHLADVLDRGSG